MRSFLVGLGVGIGLGVLFAPMSGEETRNNIRDRAGDLADQARETYEQGRDRMRTGVTAIRDMAQRATGTTGAAGSNFGGDVNEANG
jgi:gas vesicle protein